MSHSDGVNAQPGSAPMTSMVVPASTRDRAAHHGGIGHVQERARRRVDLLAAHAVGRVARDDEEELLVTRLHLVVIVRQHVARLRGAGEVGAERADAEETPDRLPLGVRRLARFERDVVDVCRRVGRPIRRVAHVRAPFEIRAVRIRL